MLFENLTVGRVILHEVFRRKDDKQKIQPKYGNAIISLSGEALDTFRDRVIAALGSQSQCMQMKIDNVSTDSAFGIAQKLLPSDDSGFKTTSQLIADRLAEVQTARNLPGGVLVIFDGKVGQPSQRFLGIIKAETQTGFTRHVNPGGSMVLEYLKDLILTPQTKLYKIGMFVEGVGAKTPADWSAFVYDNQMVASSREGAAQYFYESFLGCVFPEDLAFQTKKFYDLTKAFIRSLSIDEEEKTDLHTGLYTYLKVDQSSSVEVSAFSNSYLKSKDVKDAYGSFMLHHKFPMQAIKKDISELRASLRQRRVIFASDIRLTAPAESFEEKVQIEAIEGPRDADGSVPRWTRLTIRDRIRTQE